MDDLLRLGEPLSYTELMELTFDGLAFRLFDPSRSAESQESGNASNFPKKYAPQVARPVYPGSSGIYHDHKSLSLTYDLRMGLAMGMVEQEQGRALHHTDHHRDPC